MHGKENKLCMRKKLLGYAPRLFVLGISDARSVITMSSTNHQNGHPPSKKPKLDGVEGEWKVRATRESHDCVNPVRSCEEIYFKEALEKRDKSKELIKVSIGKEQRKAVLWVHMR